MSAIQTRHLSAADLFVVLEKAYRKRARNCDSCNFSLPFATDSRSAYDANWAVNTSSACCGTCKDILEDLIAEHQVSYRLAS